MLQTRNWLMSRSSRSFCASRSRLVYPLAENEIMANASKLIFGAAIAAASIATPALAAHKGKPISAHQDGYVTRSSQGSGVYDLYDPGTESPQCQSRNPPPSCPYHYVPGSRSGG